MTQIEQPTLRLAPNDTYRILMLDNVENIDKLKETCKQAGHQVVPVLRIKQAMEFLETRDHVDVIISAAHLENESVFEFLQKVKDASSHLRAVPFLIVCSDPSTFGLTTSSVVQMATALMGADKYLLMLEFDENRLMEEIDLLLPAMPSKELSSA